MFLISEAPEEDRPDSRTRLNSYVLLEIQACPSQHPDAKSSLQGVLATSFEDQSDTPKDSFETADCLASAGALLCRRGNTSMRPAASNDTTASSLVFCYVLWPCKRMRKGRGRTTRLNTCIEQGSYCVPGSPSSVPRGGAMNNAQPA